MYDLITKHFPDFNNPKLTKENIYSHIYPGEKFSDSTVRGLLSAALKLGENFLAVTHLTSIEHHYQNFLLSELGNRKITDLFNIHVKSIRTEVDKIPSQDEDYFFLKFRIETLLSTLESKTYNPLTQKDIPGDNHTKDTDNLINFFLITLLKRYNYLLTKTGSLNVSPDLKFFDEVMQYLEKTDLTNIPVLNFHYNRAKLYTSDMYEKYFIVLKNVLYNDFDKLDHSERYNLFATLQNFCVQRNRNKDEDTSELQYELYEFGMKNDILTFNEMEPMHHTLFSNIVGAAISLNKIEDAKNIIEKYKNRLAPERIESAVNLNSAKIYFKEKKYNKALECLAIVHQDDVFYKASIKNLYAMIYYENGLIEELVLLLDSYRSFLSSNILLGEKFKETHQKFTAVITKLVKLKDLDEKSEIEYLKHEAEQMNSLLCKPWLIEKIKELLK